jgi:uncharacterized protein YceH (UPF0502 family)
LQNASLEHHVTPELTAMEARVIGCLIEKSITTPDQYPLTLNSLTNACNQKSSRNPVMALSKGEVQRTVRYLDAKSLVRINEDFKSRTEKYVQRFCNTQFSDYQFDDAELAIVCLLLLRGAQTPGELRSRSGRLHSFADNDAVVEALARLIEREGGPLVVKLPRSKGRKDSEYMHLFCGPVDVDTLVRDAPPPAKAGSESRMDELEQRIATLEAEVRALRERHD